MSFFRKQDDIYIIIIITSFQFIIGLLSLRILLWFIFGKEKVSIENDQLILSKKGTFWIRKEKHIPLKEIKKISISKNFFEANSPSESVGEFSRKNHIFKIQNTGRIEIILSNFNSFRFLDNVDFDVANFIIEKINIARNITLATGSGTS